MSINFGEYECGDPIAWCIGVLFYDDAVAICLGWVLQLNGWLIMGGRGYGG